MKLTILHTENTLSEGPFKKLIGFIKQRGFNSSPKQKAIQSAIERAFQETWGDFHGNPRAQKRIEIYKASILQHPELLKSSDPYTLAKDLFRKRGERIIGQQQDPGRTYRSLGLNSAWASDDRT